MSENCGVNEIGDYFCKSWLTVVGLSHLKNEFSEL